MKHKSRKVLVVDDDPAQLFLIERILTKQGFHIDTTIDAIDAIECVQRGDHGLVLCDQIMPNISGLDVLGRIRALDMNVQVVLYSGVLSPSLVRTAMKLGAAACILKEVDHTRLVDALEHASSIHERWRATLRHASCVD